MRSHAVRCVNGRNWPSTPDVVALSDRPSADTTKVLSPTVDPSGLVTFAHSVAVSPQWDSLRGDPRFAQCLERMGLHTVTTAV